MTTTAAGRPKKGDHEKAKMMLMEGYKVPAVIKATGINKVAAYRYKKEADEAELQDNKEILENIKEDEDNRRIHEEQRRQLSKGTRIAARSNVVDLQSKRESKQNKKETLAIQPKPEQLKNPSKQVMTPEKVEKILNSIRNINNVSITGGNRNVSIDNVEKELTQLLAMLRCAGNDRNINYEFTVWVSEGQVASN